MSIMTRVISQALNKSYGKNVGKGASSEGFGKQAEMIRT